MSKITVTDCSSGHLQIEKMRELTAKMGRDPKRLNEPMTVKERIELRHGKIAKAEWKYATASQIACKASESMPYYSSARAKREMHHRNLKKVLDAMTESFWRDEWDMNAARKAGEQAI